MTLPATAPRLVLLANPHSGGGKARAIAERAAAVLTGMGIGAEVLAPSTIEAMREGAASACASHPMAVIACGGDGTVHQVLQAAAASSTPMAIIPAGTGNDIARSLGIARKDVELVAGGIGEAALAGSFRTIDLTHIRQGGREAWSMGVMSTGFDSAVNERADRGQRFNGTTRYVLAMLAELRIFRTHEYVLTIDGLRIEGAATLIAIGNGSNYGGGMRICPAAIMDDGLLDVTWVDRVPRRTILRVFPRIFSGTHVRHPAVRVYQGRSIVVESVGPILYADGERIGELPVEATVIEGGLRMLAQAGRG